MTPAEIAETLKAHDAKIILVYAFNATGKTRLSVAFKDSTKTEDGEHTGVYYNAYGEDLFAWENEDDEEGTEFELTIRTSSLNKFHESLSEDLVRDKLDRYKPPYRFEFVLHDNPQDGIQAIRFFVEVADAADANVIKRVPIKVSRGEERIFVWCFFLALFEADGWADKQSSHFFIDDPVSSLDEHNIFVTASTLYDLIESQYKSRKIILTTHHIGLFSILSDWLMKGEKGGSFKKVSKLFILSGKSGALSLESCRNDVLLYHLRLLQVLDIAQRADDVRAYHLVLLRQVLENIASFLGVGQFSYVLKQIGITDEGRIASILNTLSHKRVYYYESDLLNPNTREMFDDIFQGLRFKYDFVLHTE